MQYAIELPGLLASHPAAALATYGLYSVVPDATIYHKPDRGSYYPVLKSEFQSVDDLANHLASATLWDGLNLPPDSSVADLGAFRPYKTQFFLNEFVKLAGHDLSLACGIGTDLRLAQKKFKGKPEIAVARSPLFMLSRQATFYGGLTLVRRLVVDHPQETKKALLEYPWDKSFGQNFGFFFDMVSDKVSKNTLVAKRVPCNGTGKLADGPACPVCKTEPKVTSKRVYGKHYASDPKGSTVLTVPAVCLLAVASWRLFPCFVQGRNVLAPGWHQEGRELFFTYPIFTNPRGQTRQEAVSWLQNINLSDMASRPNRKDSKKPSDPDRLNFSRNRQAWRRLGVAAVYRAKKFKYPKGGSYLLSPSSL